MRARRLRWSSIHCSDALAKTRSRPSPSQVAMSPCDEGEPGARRSARPAPGPAWPATSRRRPSPWPPSPRAGSWSGRRSRSRGRRRARRGRGGTASGDRRTAADVRSGTARTGRGSTRRSESRSLHSCLVRPETLARPQAGRRGATRRLTWANGSRAGPAAARGRRPPSPPPARRATRAAAGGGGVGVRRRAASSTVRRLPRKVVQARPSRTTRWSCTAGSAQSRCRSSLVIFSAIVASPALGLGVGQTRPRRRPARRRGASHADRDQLAPRSAASVTSSPSGTARTWRTAGPCRGPPRPSSGRRRSRCRRPGSARSTGAAPRQRGRSEKCRFTIGTWSSSRAGMIRPKATTTASSTPAATRSSMSWVTGMPELERQPP